MQQFKSEKGKANISGLLKQMPLIVLTVLALFPLYFMIVTAFKSQNEYVINKFGIPSAFTLSNFSQVFNQGSFFNWFANSSILTISSVCLSLIIATLAAFSIAKFRFYGKSFIFKLMVALMVLPPVVMVVPLFGMMSKLGLINSRFGVVILYTGLLLPFSIYLLTNFFKSVPNEIIHSAQIDGCNMMGVLVKIIVPLSLPSFMSLIIVNALWVWNELLISVIFLQGDNFKTLMVGLTVFKSKFTLNIPVTMAGLIISTLPISLLYIFGQKTFIEGLTAGAIKG